MKRRLASLLFCAAAGTFQVLAQQTSALAQQAPALALNPAQTEGRVLFSKSCSICHLPPQFGAGTYGPRLNQASLGGNESVMREVISNGTPRMPAFKHNFNPVQIDAIIGYLKTVPAQSAAALTPVPVQAAPGPTPPPNPASFLPPGLSGPIQTPTGSGAPIQIPTRPGMPMSLPTPGAGPMPMPTGPGTPMPLPTPGAAPTILPAMPGGPAPTPANPPRPN